MEGQHIQENVPMSVPLEHEGAGDTPVIATVSEASLEWDAYADGGYDLLRENNSHGSAWMQFPNIHRMQPAKCGNYSSVSPFSTTWIEHTSKIWKSSYPYTFYRTSFDDDFEDYKSCESEDDFYSCDSNESDVEELQINFGETSQVNINIDTLTIQLKFTVSSVSLTQTNKTRSQAKITETTNFKDNNVFPQENAEMSAGKCSYYAEIRLNEATSDSQLFTEYAEFDEQMNDNDDKELKPLVQPTSFHSNHAINRLLDPFENAANVYNNYQLVSISPSGSDPDIDAPHFIVLCPNSNGNFVEDAEFILNEEYYEDSYIENTTNTSYQLSEKILESDNSFFGLSATSAVEKTPMYKHIRSNESGIDYLECSKMDITNQSEIIGDNDLLLEKDFPSMKIKFVDSMESVIAYGITNASDVTKDALQMPDDMTGEDEGKTIDDEKMLCNLIDDYVNRTLSPVSSQRPSSDGSACSSDTIHCDEVNSICSMEDTELQDQLLTKPLEWKYNPIFIPKNEMNREIENEVSVGGMLMNAYPDVLTNNGSGGQNSLYKIVTENNQHIIVFPHSTDQKERNTADVCFRKLPEKLEVNEESLSSSYKEKTTITSDQSSENEFESDNSFFSLSASSSVKNTQMHENGRSNEFTIDYQECSKIHISDQSEIIGDNDLLPEKDPSSMEMKFVDRMKSIVGYGITNASDMTKDALQTLDDMTDEDEGKTKDDEKMQCNLKDDYVNRTLSSISSPRPSSNESACSSDTIHCDEVNSICSMEDTELQDQLLTKPLEWKYNPIFIPKNEMNREIENEASVGGMVMNAYPDVLTNNGSGGQNSLYKIVTENNEQIIVSPHSTDQKERNTADTSFRKLPEKFEVNEESLPPSHKEKTTITSDQSLENEFESDSNFFSSSASSSVENTQMHEKGMSNEFTIDYPECSKMDITDQSEIIGDNDLLPEKDFPSMKMKFVDNMKSIVSYGITNASDMIQDTLQMPDDLTDEDEGKTKDDEKILCNLIDDYVTRTILSVRDELYREVKDIETRYHDMQYKQPSNNKQTSILEEKLQKHLNVEIPSPESKSNTLETNNSLKHDKISHQLYVEEESLYHKHDTENKPYEAFNVLLSRTETTVKCKAMSESYVENTYSGEDEESDALRYKDHPSDYVDFEKGFVSSSLRPSSDGSACSSDIVQCDEVHSIRSMEDTELQDQLLTKPLEWNYNLIYPKKAMNSKIEKQASFEMIYPDVLTNNGSGGQNSLYKIVTENNQNIIVSPHSTDQNERNSADISFRKISEEFDENEESSSSSHKEKTTSTSDQSSENVSESDNSFFTSSASSSVENTQMHENGRSNEFTIDYPECSKSDISYQSEIISDNDLLPEKDFPSMKINSVDNVESVVARGITNDSDMRQDTLQMPDDLTDEDKGKTKDDEKILCNLIDDYVTRTILSIRDELYREVKDIETEYHHMQYTQPSNNKQTSILEEKLPKQLNVEIPSPESKSNTLETNNSLKHDKISHQLYVEEESLYHKHDTEIKPYEAFNVLLSRTETTVKCKAMSESYVENTYSGEDEESDALRYKDHPSDYVDFEKGFVSSSLRPSSDGSACSSDIVQCDEVNSIRSMEDTELQDQLLTKPLEWNYNLIYPKKAMNSKIEKQASFEMIYPDVLTNNGSGGQNSLYKIVTENNQNIIVSPHSTDQNERNSADISFRKISEEFDENEESSSSSHKEKTTSTSDQSSENVSESDNSFFTSSASSSVENTQMHENGRSNEFTIDYPECSKSDISYQSEIISDNDLLPEKDFPSMKINSVDNVESVVARGITNDSDMRQDTLQMPDDLTDEDEGKTKDDEKILCNLIDDYVTRTILSIRDELYREVKDIETEYHHMQYKQPSNNKQTSILEEKLPKQLNVEIPSPESKSNTLETNNSLKHDKISHQLYVEEESLYHKHDTENKPYEAFNVLLSRTETTVKRKAMSESYVENTYSGEDEESDALRYKDHPSDYVDFEKGFVSSSLRPSSDGSACSSDIVQCDEVNSIRSMEDTELQDQLLTKPLEWNYNLIYPKKAMNSKIEKQASFEMIYPDVLTNNGSGGQNSLYKIVTENNQNIIVSPHSTDQNERNSADISFRKISEEFDENEESSSSSHKEKTTSTSDQSSENVSESDNSLFTSSASSSVENTQMHENGRSNEFTIDYPECSKSDISYQSEIISDNDLLPEKDFPSMKINSVDNVESVVARGITNDSDMRQDTLQMPDDLTDEDEGKTKDDEKILCNLIDDYVTRTILSIRDELYREVKDIETEYHHMQYKQPSNNDQRKILEEKLPKQLNVEIPSPESKSNTLETNNALTHDNISQQLYVEEESLYHKHDAENKPYEAFNVFSNRTATKVKPKVMSESYMNDTYNVEYHESEALRYKDHPSDYLDFEKGFVSSSSRPSSNGSACSSDIVQCDEVNSIRSMEDTELQDELLTKPLEWSYNPIYPKKAMNSKIEKQASFEMIYPDVLTNNGSGGQNSLYKKDTENNQHIIVSPHSTDQKERNSADISFRKISEEFDENEESSSSSHKEKTTSTSDQSSENVSESDNSLFTSSASSSVEDTPVQENGRSNEFTIDYPECSTSDISYQSEIISDNDLLPEKDYSTMKINSADNVESVVARGITDVSDMRQDTLQMPDDLTDEDEGKTKDDEKILCNLIDDYVTRTILSIRDELYREVKDIETEYHHMQYKQPSNNNQRKILEEKLPKQLNVEIHSPESKSNILETNNSLKHDRISQQLYVEEESLYHKHDTENTPYEAFNVLSNRTATKVKPKVMSESYMDDIYSGEEEESDALRYKDHPSDYLDFNKGFVSSSPRPSSDGSACSSDIVQCDEVNSIRSMEDTELQDQLLAKPLEWNYNLIYPKKAMNSKIEKQASFEMIYPDMLTNNDSGGQNSLYKIVTENNQNIIVSPHSTDQNERNSADISFRKISEEFDENEESSSSSHKEKTTSTSDQSSENVSESDNSLFTSSASSSVENTPVQENGRSNEFTIDYPECSTSDISYQSEIISDNDLLPEKDYSTMKINFADSVESVVARGITNDSDMRQDTLQMPDDLTDEDEGKTKDDEKILCNLIDDYVTRTILSIRDELYREVKDIETGYHDMQYTQPSNNKQTSILEEKLQKQLNVEIHSPESKSNTLEINNSLKHDKISHQLYVEEESLYHKHDTENKPYEAFNVSRTETTVKRKVMSESYVENTYSGEDEESDALRYKDHPSDYLDFEKGFVSSSPRPSSDGSACSTDIIQCDEVNSIRSMENTELQDQLLTKPSEWKYIPMYIPKNEMKNKTEKEASFDQKCTQSINGIECHLECNPDTVKFDKNYTHISNQEDETNLNRIGVKYIDRKEYKIELANDGDTIRLDKECKHAIEQERKHGLNGTDLVLYLDPMRFDQKCKHTADVEPHRSFNDITSTVDRSYADWHDTKTDTASTKPLETKFNPTYIPKNALNFSKMSDNSLSKIPVYERCNSPTGSSSVSSSNIGIKVADLAKKFSSSQFDTRNSIRRNRNYCEDLDVSVTEISKTFDDSSDINTSQVRQMPKRQKGKQMEWKLNPIYIPQKAISSQIEKEATFDSMASNAYDVLTNNSSGGQNRIMDDASLDNLVPGVAASKTCIYSGNNSINGDPSFDNLVMKCDPDCTKLQKADKRDTIKNTLNVSKMSDNSLSKIPVYESCSSRTGSSNTGVKVADLAKMFSSSKLDIMNSMRRNRNACKELDVSVSEILKTFVDSSDINISNARQMPVRQKGKQMDSTSPDRVTKGRIHVQDERNIANKNQDAIVENVSNKHDETNVESKGNEVENSSFQSLNTDVDSIYTRYTSKDDKGYLATFLKRKKYSPVKLKYLHESKPVKIDHNKLRTIIKSQDQPQRPYSEEIEKRKMLSEADPNQTCTSDHPANVEESQKNLPSENKKCTRRANKSDDDDDDDDDDYDDDDDDQDLNTEMTSLREHLLTQLKMKSEHSNLSHSKPAKCTRGSST